MLLLNGPIGNVKEKLRLFKEQGTDVHNIYQSYFHFFTTDQTSSCMEFVTWCADNYSLSERVIMDITSSTVLYPITPLSIRKTLSIHEYFTLKAQDYKEESIFQCFKDSLVENKQYFFGSFAFNEHVNKTILERIKNILY